MNPRVRLVIDEFARHKGELEAMGVASPDPRDLSGRVSIDRDALDAQ